MADLSNTKDTQGVSLIDESNGYAAKVDANGRVLVSTLPVPPTAATPVSQTAYSSMSSTVDTDYVIPNDKNVTILFFAGSGQADSDGTAVELYYDPNGTGVGMTLIDVGIVSGNSFQNQLDITFTGNGTRKIKLRRRRLTGSAIDVFGRWSGYLT